MIVKNQSTELHQCIFFFFCLPSRVTSQEVTKSTSDARRRQVQVDIIRIAIHLLAFVLHSYKIV